MGRSCRRGQRTYDPALKEPISDQAADRKVGEKQRLQMSIIDSGHLAATPSRRQSAYTGRIP